jgi:MinD-like ATPase involved in chromosome partitioning or flagellar assembly
MTKHILCHSYKGGVGTTTVACSIALLASQDNTRVLLVDCSPHRDTLSWLGLPNEVFGFHEEVHPNLDLALVNEKHYPFTEAIRRLDDYEVVVIDAGTTNYRLFTESVTKVLVVRNDYMALRNAVNNKVKPDTAIVVLMEPNRVLTFKDAGQVLGGSPIVKMEWDEAVPRAIDAGLMPTRAKDLVGGWVSELMAPMPI